MAYALEVTDTFGGESNYTWVKRGTSRAKSRRQLLADIKKLAGWDGWIQRVRVEHDGGDFLEVRPPANSGVCQVAFATWVDDETT